MKPAICRQLELLLFFVCALAHVSTIGDKKTNEKGLKKRKTRIIGSKRLNRG
jgi:hypothetical protein